MKFRIVFLQLIPFLLAFIPGCVSEQASESDSGQREVDTLNSIADSLLIAADFVSTDLSRDYGIVTVDDIDATSQGLIAILDGAKATITIIKDSTGVLFTAGGSGSGPGEFQWPTTLSISEDGHVAVSDMMAGTVRIMDPDLATYVDVAGFTMENPGVMHLWNNGDFTGMRISFNSENGNTVIGYQTALWSEYSSDPSIVYLEDMEPFTPSDFGRSIISPYPVACDSSGTVYIAEVSNDTYALHSYLADGTHRWSVQPPFDPVEKTEEEIQAEEGIVRARMQQSAHQVDYTADRRHNAVSSLSIGPEGRLWAGRPGADAPFFDVFDPRTGALLFTASVSEDLEFERLEVTRGGILGITAEDIPALILLEISAQ